MLEAAQIMSAFPLHSLDRGMPFKFSLSVCSFEKPSMYMLTASLSASRFELDSSVNLRIASKCNVRCRGLKLQSWIPLQTFKLQTRACFQTRNSQTFKLQTFHSPNFSNFQTLQSCPTCNTFKLSKIRVRRTPLVTPLIIQTPPPRICLYDRCSDLHLACSILGLWSLLS